MENKTRIATWILYSKISITETSNNTSYTKLSPNSGKYCLQLTESFYNLINQFFNLLKIVVFLSLFYLRKFNQDRLSLFFTACVLFDKPQ